MLQSTIILSRRALLALGVLGLATVTHAQLPVSRQTAVLPVPVSGAGTSTPVGVPFTREPVARDVVMAVSGQDITGAAGGYAPNAFANGFVLMIMSGPARGTALAITGNTADTFTVAGNVPVLANNVDEFEITPLPTIGSVFGDSTTGGPFDLTGSSSAASSDLIVIGGVRYFYKTGGVGGAGYKLESAPNATGDLGSTPITNLRGVNIIRRGTATLVGVRGVVRNGRAVLPVSTGTTLLSWPFPTEVSLINSRLQTSVQGGSGAAAADKIVINGLRYFYKNSGAASPGWKLESNPNEPLPAQNNTILNASGRAFYIIRSGAETAHPVDEQYAQ